MSHSFPYLFASYRSLFHHCRPDSPSVHCTPYWNRCTLPTCTCTVEESRWAEAWGTSCPPRPNHPNSRSVRRRCRKSRCRLRYCRWTGCCCRYHMYSATHRCHLRSHSRDHSYRRVVINYLPDNRICLETSKRISTFIQSHVPHLLEGDEDAKPVGAGKLIHVAGPVGTVLELISCIGTVFLPITHKA